MFDSNSKNIPRCVLECQSFILEKKLSLKSYFIFLWWIIGFMIPVCLNLFEIVLKCRRTSNFFPTKNLFVWCLSELFKIVKNFGYLIFKLSFTKFWFWMHCICTNCEYCIYDRTFNFIFIWFCIRIIIYNFLIILNYHEYVKNFNKCPILWSPIDHTTWNSANK